MAFKLFRLYLNTFRGRWAMPYCAVVDCIVSDKTDHDDECFSLVPRPVRGRLYTLPKSEEEQKVWIHRTGRPLSNFKTGTPNTRICARHFLRSDYNENILLCYERLNQVVPKKIRPLLPKALPSLFIPQQKTSAQLAVQRDRRIALRNEKPANVDPNRKSAETESPNSTDVLTKDASIDTVMLDADLPPLLDEIPPSSSSTVHHKVSNLLVASSSTPNTEPGSVAAEHSATYKWLVQKLYTNGEGIDVPDYASPNSLISSAFNGEKLSSQMLQDVLKRLNQLERSNKENEKKICGLEKKVEEAENCNLIRANAELEFLEAKKVFSKIFSPAQLDRICRGKLTHWTENDLSKAVVALGLSPKLYTYLRTEYQLPLPSVRSVKRYLANIKIQPGIINCLINLMSIEGSKMTDYHKVSALSFDEVMIARRFSYDAALDQVLEPKRSMQVVFARGVFANWKEPIYFDFDSPMTDKIIDEILIAMHKAGFSVISLSCDLGKTNFSFYKSKGVTPSKPYFLHPITKNKVFCIFDPPHLLKLGRNHLLDRGYDLDPKLKRQKKVATKEPIAQLFKAVGVVELGQLSVTPAHLSVKGPQRQDVRKACQVMSQKTASALMTAGQAGVLEANNYEETSFVCKQFNDFFDILNVKEDLSACLSGVPASKLPFGMKKEEQFLILEKMVEFISKARLVGKGQDSKLMDFQIGIIQTSTALPEMLAELEDRFPNEKAFLLTYRLNQDIVERFFSYFRAIDSPNETNPDVLGSKRRVKRIVFGRNLEAIMKGRHANVAPENENSQSEFLTTKTIREIMNSKESLEATKKNDDSIIQQQKQTTDKEKGDGEPETEDELSVGEGENQHDEGHQDSEDENISSDEEASTEDADPSDSPTSKLYRNGLAALAAYLAGQLYTSHPFLAANTQEHQEPLQLPVWTSSFVSGAMPASCALKLMVKDLEELFLEENSPIDTEQDVCKRFHAKAIETHPQIPVELIKIFFKKRLRARIDCLNVELKLQRGNKKRSADEARLTEDRRTTKRHKVHVS